MGKAGRPVSVASLEAKKADLLRQVQEVDRAIKAAKAQEVERKSKAITAALASRGLLDGDLDTILAAIARAVPAGTESPVAPALPGE